MLALALLLVDVPMRMSLLFELLGEAVSFSSSSFLLLLLLAVEVAVEIPLLCGRTRCRVPDAANSNV